MDNILPAVGGQFFFVHVNLPHAFSYGDGLAVTYVSTAEKNAKAVQNQACLELLCYLVVSAPGRVRLPDGCFVQGGVDVDDFRAKAIEFRQQVRFTEQSLAWQIPEIRAGQPLAAFGQHAGPGQPLAAMQPIAPPPAAAGPIEPAAGGDEAVLEILRSLRINTEYQTCQTAKHRIPAAIGKQLEHVLKKHGLLPFLQRYPQYFEVTLTGGVTSKQKPQYTFKIVAAIQPAVGGGAAVAAPAVGGLAPAIGAGGGGGCHPGSSGDGTAVDNPVHRHANRTVQCPMFLAGEFGRCTFQPQFLKPFVKLYQQRMASASRWQRCRSGLRIVDSGLGLSYQQCFCSRLLHPARRGRPWDRGP